MADPLSVVASSFAVVGVADVVLRACLKCHQLLADIEDAPASIEGLKTSLRNNTSLVEALKKHVQDIEATASPEDRAELGPAVEQFGIAVKSLRRETDKLLVRCLKYSKMKKTWANVRHVLAEKDIRKTTEQVEHAKATLSVVSSLVEGRRSAISHKNTETAISRTSSQLISAVRRIENEQTKLGSQNSIMISHAMQQKQDTSETQREIRRFRHVSQKQHDSLRRQIGRDTGLIMKKLEDIHFSTSHHLAKRESSRRILLRGADRETALTSLLLMKEHVRQAAVNHNTYVRRGISQQEMNMVLSEFNHLVSSALQETAAQHSESTATSLDRWYYSDSLGGSLLADSISYTTCLDGGKALLSTGLPDGRVNLAKFSRFWVHGTSMGRLVFSIAEILNEDTQDRYAVESQVTFIPRIAIQPVVASIRFSHVRAPNLDLELCIQLNLFRIVEDERIHEILFTYGLVEDIDTAFRENLITPYDTNASGTILSLFYAGSGVRADILRYLDSQGIGKVALNGDGDILHAIWCSVSVGLHKDFTDHHRDMQSYLDGRINSFTMSDGTNAAHFFAWHRHVFGEPDPNTEEQWRVFFSQNGMTQELQGDRIIEVSLDICARPYQESLRNISWLLELGMDPSTIGSIDLTGENGLHSSIRVRARRWEWNGRPDPISERKVLEEKLVLLIKAGISIHHRDRKGKTPSVYARGCNCWDMWCRALERAGFKVDEVLQEENNEWLQEAGWEERLIDLGYSRKLISVGWNYDTDEDTDSDLDGDLESQVNEDLYESSGENLPERTEDASDRTRENTCEGF